LIRKAALGRILVVAALGGLLTLGARYWWVFELFSHFRVQYVAVGGVLTIIAFSCRQRIPGFLLAAAVAVNAWPLLPYLPQPRDARRKFAFTVLNVNVNSGNEAFAETIGRIQAAEPDLVSILELTGDLDDALGTLADEFPYRFMLPEFGNFGIGVLSRYPLSAVSAAALRETTAIDSTVELPTGPLRFVAVHLVPPIGSSLARERNSQLDVLAALAASVEGPLLVCGDFNLTPYSPFFPRFATAANLTDTRLGTGLGISWPSFMPLLGIPIDHCLAREPILVESIERLEQIGSDHYPVKLELGWLDE